VSSLCQRSKSAQEGGAHLLVCGLRALPVSNGLIVHSTCSRAIPTSFGSFLPATITGFLLRRQHPEEAVVAVTTYQDRRAGDHKRELEIS